jgi:hypothetical protein
MQYKLHVNDETTLSFVDSFKNELTELEAARLRLTGMETGSEEANAALQQARRAALKAFATLGDFLSVPVEGQGEKTDPV